MKRGQERDGREGDATATEPEGGEERAAGLDAEVSRSARKRESQALQRMGERLVELPEGQLARIPLPEELGSAVLLARRIRERGGRRRQLQYIGRLMRGIDTRAIREALEALDVSHRHESDALHRAEQWRDRLLREGAAAVEALAEENPAIDRAKISALLRDAAAERGAGRPPRAARLLYRYLHEVIRTFPLPPSGRGTG